MINIYTSKTLFDIVSTLLWLFIMKRYVIMIQGRKFSTVIAIPIKMLISMLFTKYGEIKHIFVNDFIRLKTCSSESSIKNQDNYRKYTAIWNFAQLKLFIVGDKLV